MKVCEELENKLFICIWEETRHSSKFSPRVLFTLAAATCESYADHRLQRHSAAARAANRWCVFHTAWNKGRNVFMNRCVNSKYERIFERKMIMGETLDYWRFCWSVKWDRVLDDVEKPALGKPRRRACVVNIKCAEKPVRNHTMYKSEQFFFFFILKMQLLLSFFPAALKLSRPCKKNNFSLLMIDAISISELALQREAICSASVTNECSNIGRIVVIPLI